MPFGFRPLLGAFPVACADGLAGQLGRAYWLREP